MLMDHLSVSTSTEEKDDGSRDEESPRGVGRGCEPSLDGQRTVGLVGEQATPDGEEGGCQRDGDGCPSSQSVDAVDVLPRTMFAQDRAELVFQTEGHPAALI